MASDGKVNVLALLVWIVSTLASPVAQLPSALLPLSSSTPVTPSVVLTDDGKQVDHVQFASPWEPEQFNLPFSVSLSVPLFEPDFLFSFLKKSQAELEGFFFYFKNLIKRERGKE